MNRVNWIWIGGEENQRRLLELFFLIQYFRYLIWGVFYSCKDSFCDRNTEIESLHIAIITSYIVTIK